MAREASRYSLGTARRAFSLMETMVGRIMTASTRMAEKREEPEGSPNTLATAGTTTIIPTRP